MVQQDLTLENEEEIPEVRVTDPNLEDLV